jgi:DNA-binding beta-propeller fold protein YncE
MTRSQIALALSLAFCLGLATVNGPAAATQNAAPAARYKLLKTITLGGEGRWDYLCVDPDARRLYVPRSYHMQVVNLDKGVVVGDVMKVSKKNAHGVALAPEQNLGFISAGNDNTVLAFDLKSLKVVATLKTGANPDAILYDPFSKHILSMNHSGGDITVIDPAAMDKETVTISVGGKLEYAAADGAGHVFVCVEDKNEVVKIDSKANRVLARWSVEPGDGPTGLAIDVEHHRLFAGCGNKKMVVLDSQTGKVLATPAIGNGVDGVAFEPTLNVAISANGKDGTASIVKEMSPGSFEVIQTVKTLPGARTVAVDTKTHQALFPCNVPDGNGGQTFGIAVVGLSQ